MGIRDLVFIGLVVGGLSALAWELIPPAEVPLASRYDAEHLRSSDHRQAVVAVDRLFLEHWQAEGLKPAERAPTLQIARRLALGLTGTIPSLEEIRQLEALPEEQCIPWYVDHLLEDRRYADFFAERLLRAYVGADEGPFLLYRGNRFRTWIADQIAKNQPYDHIVRDLIASRGLWTDHAATNFITATSLPMANNQPDPIRLAGRTTRAFLGLRIDCAQCHNHPFAAWKQSDFEGLSAFYGQVEVGFQGVQDHKRDYSIEDSKTQQPRVIEPTVPYSPHLLPERGTRRERLAAWVTHRENPYFARAIVNRVWALMTGRALVEPVDNLEPDGTPSEGQGTPIGARVLDLLARDFSATGYDLRKLIRKIAETYAFQIDSAGDFELTDAHEDAWAVFPLTRLRPEQVAGSLLQASSIRTINADSHILSRLMKFGQQNEFIKRYGDNLDEELEPRGGTIPQRLLLMNGKLIRERIDGNPINATPRIATLSPNDNRTIEVAYLAILTRRPTDPERDHFLQFLRSKDLSQVQKVQDLTWALINSTEFSWNH
jgi:hypothetical protein